MTQPTHPHLSDEQNELTAMAAIWAAWHGAGVDISGGNWGRFAGMLPLLYTTTPTAVNEQKAREARYTLDEIGNACTYAGIPDSQFESLSIDLERNQCATPPTAVNEQKAELDALIELQARIGDAHENYGRNDERTMHARQVFKAALSTALATPPAAAEAPAVPSDALSDFLEAQDALDNHELNGKNGIDYFTLVRRRNDARKDLDAALAAQTVCGTHRA